MTRGGYSMIEATLRLLRIAVENDMDYYHLISGQDFPCRENKEFDEFFEKNEGKSYMHFDSEEFWKKAQEKNYPYRVKPWYFTDIPHREICLINFMARSLNFISKRIYWRRDIPNLWSGWQWFTWHKTVAEYVINEEVRNPKFFKRFHHTNCPDELVFTTLLHGKMAQLNIVGNNSLRYINWNKKEKGRTRNGSPLTLNEDEYEEIVNSGAFFCRKVHPTISAKLLLLLEKHIKGQ